MGPRLKTPKDITKSAANLDTIPARADVVKNEAPVKAEGPAKKEDSAAIKERRDSILGKMYDEAVKREWDNFYIASEGYPHPRPDRQTFEKASLEHGLAAYQSRLYLAAILSDTKEIKSIRQLLVDFGKENAIGPRVEEILRNFDLVMGN